jgi:hypothetical protein
MNIKYKCKNAKLKIQNPKSLLAEISNLIDPDRFRPVCLSDIVVFDRIYFARPLK